MVYDSAKALIDEIRAGKILPVYILSGEEPFFIDEVTKIIEDELMTEGEKSFNMSVLYGRDTDLKQLLDHARQFPMMASRRIVILKEAQQMREIKNLDGYLSHPAPQTLLLIAHKKKLDGRIKWVKQAKSDSSIGYFESAPIREYQMAKWVIQYVKSLHHTISPEAAEVIVQYLGTDLSKITNEIAKIQLNLKKGDRIDTEHIKTYIGIDREYDIYALLKALSQGDLSQVQFIADQIEANEKSQPLQMILPGMATYFEKVLVVTQHFKKDDRTLSAMIGTYASFLQEYRAMARRFGYRGLIKVYDLITLADGYAKGVDRRSSEGIFKELIGKIILCQSIELVKAMD